MWNVASWDKDSAGKLPNQKLLSKVGSFTIYVNDNDNELQNNAGRPRTGDLVFDSIKLVGERDPYVPEEKSSEPSNAKLITIDDFESYADEAAMKEAWGNREHTDVLSLTTEDDDNKYLQYSNPHGGWLDVATFIQNNTARNNWTGLGKLTFRLKHDGSNNAMDLQIGTADGKYFHVDQKLASEDGADWKTVEIDLVNNPSLTQSWPEDENKGKTMTADDLALFKEVVIAGNTWNNDSPAVNFAVDDLKVVPSGDASDSKPETKPEEPSEPTEPTEPEETPDYSADMAAGDPATCPIDFTQQDTEDPSDPSDPDQPTDTDKPAGADKPADANKPAAGDNAQSGDNAQQSNAKADENKSVVNTGSSIAVVAAIAVALVLAGAATLVWVRQRRQQ